MKLFVVPLAAALALSSACAGTQFSYAQARRVEVGMTEAQLAARMGRPYSVVSRPEGQLWIWSHANGFSGSSKAVSFLLKDGVVVQVPEIPASFK